jgi:hypothetical protein
MGHKEQQMSATTQWQELYESAGKPHGGNVRRVYAAEGTLGGLHLIVELTNRKFLSPYFNQMANDDGQLEEALADPIEWADNMAGATDWQESDWDEVARTAFFMPRFPAVEPTGIVDRLANALHDLHKEAMAIEDCWPMTGSRAIEDATGEAKKTLKEYWNSFGPGFSEEDAEQWTSMEED